ncbi:MAG: hypothetical protein IJR14_02885 [Synergistaceae bacterium]|nr:hypothetical protein [Synergistaceae bacterium]
MSKTLTVDHPALILPALDELFGESCTGKERVGHRSSGPIARRDRGAAGLSARPDRHGRATRAETTSASSGCTCCPRHVVRYDDVFHFIRSEGM